MLSTERVESSRLQALKFFNADPEHFDLVFVANATAAIKLVAECISDYSQSTASENFWYGYHGDSHTSLVGVRQVASPGTRCYELDEDVTQWLRWRQESAETPHDNGHQVGLFAYPAQSNMNGRRLPLNWPGQIRATNSEYRETYSLLDVAAYVATAQLDLSDSKNAPDFIALSFYKIFGFPDLGALIVRKASCHVLQARRYFGGGTVDMVVNGDDSTFWHAKKTTSLHDMLEDGTPAFHSIAALRIAFISHQKLYGSMANVSKHTTKLIEVLFSAMAMLTHADGLRVCEIYKGSTSQYGNSESQGPTIAFNIRNSDGEWVGKSDFERLAILNCIQIRTGGVCNPGGIASSLQISQAEMRKNFEEGVRCGNEIDEINGKLTGIIRVSLGAMSSMKDIERFMKLVRLFVDHTPAGPRTMNSNVRREMPSLHRTPLTLVSKAVVEVSEDIDIFTCPIATCMKYFGSREERWSHLPDHKADTRRKRSIWRFLMTRHRMEKG